MPEESLLERTMVLKTKLEATGKVSCRLCLGAVVMVVGYAGENWLVTLSAKVAGHTWAGQIAHVETVEDVLVMIGVKGKHA